MPTYTLYAEFPLTEDTENLVTLRQCRILCLLIFLVYFIIF